MKRHLGRWLAIIASGLLVLLASTTAILLSAERHPPGAAGPTPSASATAGAPAPEPSATPGPTVGPATPGTTTPSPPAPTSPKPTTPAPTSAAGELRPGASGPEVLALQRRLTALGYWLGTPDGRYGYATQHAVTAFQKAAGLHRDAIAGPATRQALEHAVRLRPRSTSGHVIEIDLRRQLLLVATGGRVDWVFDTSTGAVAGTTPRGWYRIEWQVDGYHQSPLGVLYRPKYFHGGVAVHGYPSVPPYPASHGCVRVINPAMDWLWSSGAAPLGTAVWVY